MENMNVKTKQPAHESFYLVKGKTFPYSWVQQSVGSETKRHSNEE
jgi:hypothetical protein